MSWSLPPATPLLASPGGSSASGQGVEGVLEGLAFHQSLTLPKTSLLPFCIYDLVPMPQGGLSPCLAVSPFAPWLSAAFDTRSTSHLLFT